MGQTDGPCVQLSVSDQLPEEAVNQMEILAKLYIYTLIWVKINSESPDDDSYTNIFNSYSPSSVNFQDIYTNALTLQSDDSSTDDDLPVSSLATQYAEFHPNNLKTQIIPSSKTKKHRKGKNSTMAYTNEPDEIIKVIPIRNPKGVLDVLFPAARVKSFKSVFNSFKRFLSQTLRRR